MIDNPYYPWYHTHNSKDRHIIPDVIMRSYSSGPPKKSNPNCFVTKEQFGFVFYFISELMKTHRFFAFIYRIQSPETRPIAKNTAVVIYPTYIKKLSILPLA